MHQNINSQLFNLAATVTRKEFNELVSGYTVAEMILLNETVSAFSRRAQANEYFSHYFLMSSICI